MLAETQDDQEIIARVAALDIGKAELVCCVRIPDEDRPRRRLQEVETYSTMTRPLLSMADHLRCCSPTPAPPMPNWAATSTTPASNPERRKRNHIRQLEALGYKVTLEPAAA